MRHTARVYQQDVKNKCYDAWRAGHRNVMAVIPTGGGKTKVEADVTVEFDVPTAIQVHRGELVGQISAALANEEVRHDIIADQKVIKGIVNNHMEEYGVSYYNPRSEVKVISVDTIIRRDPADPWFKRVGLCVMDEAHHVLQQNKWGKAMGMFPNAYGLLLTATPTRADGKGLGRHHDGLADALVEGPTMRWLINNGYLTDYRVMCPQPSDLNLDDVEIISTGEFNHKQLQAAFRRSTKIVADVVSTYVEHAYGKLGVTFAIDVEEARKLTDEYNRRGVPAVLLTGNDDPDTRRQALKRFRNREVWQLVNVDLFGEGFDLPAIECVSFARPTASFSLYAQQWGRALRLMISKILMAAWDTYTPEQRKAFIAGSEKPVALIFDHVGNLLRHKGPPDKLRVWTLDRRDRRAPRIDDGIPLRVCSNKTCMTGFERTLDRCPICNTVVPPPALRGGPEHVDGNLEWVDEHMLATMRGEVSRIDGPFYAPNGLVGDARRAAEKRHHARQVEQAWLRNAIGTWAAVYPNASPAENYRRFYLTFGVDVLSAMSLGPTEASNLREKIGQKLALEGIVIKG